MKYQYLLLDLDGTLLGSQSLSLNLRFTIQFVRTLRAAGFPIWRGLRILHKQKLKIRDISHQHNKIKNLDKAYSFFSELSGLSLKESTELLSVAARDCFQYASPAFYQIPEALEFLEWAKPRYKLALATNPLWPKEIVHYRLKLANISPDIFEFITHAENMSACKPHVHYYRELLETWNLSPEKCIMVGNDKIKDGPAELVGIDTFILNQHSDFTALRKKLEKSL
jgi:FMN phosphatase YigB (HAD superfamily)